MTERTFRHPVFYGLLLGGLMLSLVSCGHSRLSTRASRVYLLTTQQVHLAESECEFLGNVTGHSTFSYETALNELMDNAAELGATHLFVNIGRKKYLRGEAYRCAYCLAKDGNPDVGYCVDDEGERIRDFCQNDQGEVVGEAHCQDAQGETRKECRENCGIWVQAIAKSECQAQGNTWVEEPSDQPSCAAIDGTWLPAATDEYTCEQIKGGEWVLNKDVIRILQQEEEVE